MNAVSQDIATIVGHFVGCSLDNRKDELAQLVARGVDDPNQIVQVATNCGTFSLGILWKLGIKHPILEKKYVSGMAIADLITIGHDLKCMHAFDGKTFPTQGCLILYHMNGNDYHAEWFLTDPDDKHVAIHAGGGRSRNAVTASTSDIRWNVGRQIWQWLDVPSLCQTQIVTT